MNKRYSLVSLVSITVCLISLEKSYGAYCNPHYSGLVVEGLMTAEEFKELVEGSSRKRDQSVMMESSAKMRPNETCFESTKNYSQSPNMLVQLSSANVHMLKQEIQKAQQQRIMPYSKLPVRSIEEKKGAEKDYFHFLKTFIDDPRNIGSKTTHSIVQNLMDVAKRKKQSFTSGIFVVEDPHQFLFNFLRKNKEVYTTDCHHFAERTLGPKGTLGQPQAFGIDLDFSEIAPDKKHLLFNTFRHEGTTWTFIKLKKYGTQKAQDSLRQIFEGVKALQRKMSVGANDQPHMRKEYVPANILALWNSMVDTVFCEKKDEKETHILTKNYLKQQGQDYGIYKMLEITARPDIAQYAPWSQGIWEQLHKTIIDRYDHVKVRKGNEVIISQEELNKVK